MWLGLWCLMPLQGVFFRFDVAWFMVFNATSSFFLGLMWLGLWCLMPLQVFNVKCKWRVMYLT